MPRVAMNEGTRSRVVTRPLMVPTTTPLATPSRNAAHSGHPPSCSVIPIRYGASTNTPPTGQVELATDHQQPDADGEDHQSRGLLRQYRQVAVDQEGKVVGEKAGEDADQQQRSVDEDDVGRRVAPEALPCARGADRAARPPQSSPGASFDAPRGKIGRDPVEGPRPVGQLSFYRDGYR